MTAAVSNGDHTMIRADNERPSLAITDVGALNFFTVIDTNNASKGFCSATARAPQHVLSLRPFPGSGIAHPWLLHFNASTVCGVAARAKVRAGYDVVRYQHAVPPRDSHLPTSIFAGLCAIRKWPSFSAISPASPSRLNG